MRVVLDTNILVSAFLIQLGHPAAIYREWHERHFTLLTCSEQLDELRDTLRKPALAARIKPHKAGRLVNELKELAETIGSLPRVERSSDPTDDFLLALSEVGKADYLVTGDKGGLLALPVTRPRGSYLRATSPRYSRESPGDQNANCQPVQQHGPHWKDDVSLSRRGKRP